MPSRSAGCLIKIALNYISIGQQTIKELIPQTRWIPILVLKTLRLLNYSRSRINCIKQQKLALPISPTYGHLQRTSVDTANLVALGLPFVICLFAVFLHIPLFIMNKCNNSLTLSVVTV